MAPLTPQPVESLSISASPPRPLESRRNKRAVFIKGWFWRMCPRSGFCTIVPFFVPSFRFWVPLFHFWYPLQNFQGTQARKRQHKLFGPVALGTTPGNVLGTNPGFLLILHNGSPVCPWDKPSLSPGQSRERRATQEVYVLRV